MRGEGENIKSLTITLKRIALRRKGKRRDTVGEEERDLPLEKKKKT